jgi:hypothetical protein
LRWTRTGHGHGRARPILDAALRSSTGSRRTLGLLGIAGLSAAATVGFGTSAMASPSPSATGDKPSAPATTLGVDLVPRTTSVKSGGTVTYSAVLTVAHGPVKDANVTITGDVHGGRLVWSGCDKVLSAATSGTTTCHLDKVANGTTAKVTKLTAPKVKADTPITLAVRAGGKGANDKKLTSKATAHTVTVQKAPTSKPTPTKTVKPTPTPTKSHKPTSHPTKSHKPTSHPTKSHTSGSHAHHAKPPATHHAKTPSIPRDNGHVPLPTTVPTSGLPSVPYGTQSPFPFDRPTSKGVPTLPTVAPSPDGPVRSPKVADPQKKATGLVRTDAVSVPAAAAAAFVGLGAGTLITRAVRRRGLWHPIGRHRE